ncbi:MAG: TetR/AcrR family transcriptional regulator [Acidimicrobiia bacterium]|nr:TetR/AcrR family transcriptional regulator [Acidimicrobiia bacterium]MYB73298.1 TetR/AcrR family transcriptional regulator [Acidimicrobiia bacterium]MYI00106.1 TetR/AcrR family transcriptional regulator [Acidimicrobiia bacterium]
MPSTPASHSRSPGRGSSAEESTERLLDAAASVFGESGFEGARVAHIARRCGLTTGAVYSRWLTKQELFLAAVENRASRGTEKVAGRSDLSTLEKLAAMGSALAATSDNEADNLLLEACVIARRDDEMIEGVARSLDEEAAVIAGMIEEGKAAGEVDPALSTEAIVFACQSLSLGVRLAAAAAPRRGGQPSADDWNELLARFVTSIGPRAGGADSTSD